jgi:hypothetical protein
MNIHVYKKGNRNRLVCTRSDGTTDITDLGPTLPFHDIAHYVVESQLGIKHGFYGNIAQGYTVKQLSDKTVIRSLPQESLIAEIITRALQSVFSGAVTMEQFPDMVRQEFRPWGIDCAVPDAHTVEAMIVRYKELLAHWELLPDGERLELDWN